MSSRDLLTFFTIFFLVPQAVSAHVAMTITEIMYDPLGADTGREWIEIHNAGDHTYELSNFRLFENNTNHKISAGEFPIGAYAVIAANPEKFKSDWPNYTGILLDSAFSLSNTGETIQLRDASTTVISMVQYSSAQGGHDGNSLNRDGSSWVSRKPSPGGAISDEAIQKPIVPTPVEKTAERTAAAEKTPAEEVLQDEPKVDPSMQIADAATPKKHSDLLWWGAALMLAISSAGAVVFARRFAKDEWEIIEGE